MPTRFIAKHFPVPSPVADANGFAFDNNDVLTVRRIKNGSEITNYIPLAGSEVKTADFTLTAADNGKTFFFDSTTSITATLPSTTVAPGVAFTFIVKKLTTSSGHKVSPVSADYITGAGLTATDGQSVQCSAATDRVGDVVTVVADGVDGWFITSLIGTWAKV